MFVPVFDRKQQPLMPTTPSRAQSFLTSGKATAFWKGGIFCVRLNVEPAAREVQPIAVGGKRKPYGGTLSQGIKRGTLVKHPKWGKAYSGGTMEGKLSLHDAQTGKRLTQMARVADCQPIKLLRWRTWLVPLVPIPTSPAPKKEDLLPPQLQKTGVSASRVR